MQSESAPPRGAPRGAWLWAILWLGVGIAVFAAARSTRPISGLGNHDVAGIAYNADLLLRGGLPYVDSVEIKAPGTFYLVAAAFLLLGRSVWTVHLACELWLILGTIGLAWLTVLLYRPGPGRLNHPAAVACAGISTGAMWLAMASFQSNYTTWIVTPSIWCLAFAHQSWRRRGWWWPLLTGISAGIAFLIKANAVVLGPAILSVWAWRRFRGDASARVSQIPMWLLGGVLPAVPLLLHYALRGADVGALISGILPLGAAASYSARVVDAPWWYVPWRLVLHLEAKYPLQLTMGSIVVAAALLRRRLPAALRLPSAEVTALGTVAIFLFWSVVGGGLGGMRYFRHYAPQYLPAMCLLVAHPGNWRTLVRLVRTYLGPQPGGGATPVHPWRRMSGRARVALIALTVAVGSLGARAVYRGDQLLSRIERGKHSHGWRPTGDDKVLASFISRNTTDEDRIFIWGWRGWSIYFYTDRQAPTAMYKGLGTITTFNFNGMFRSRAPGAPRRLEFVPGPEADALLDAFETRPPAFVVRSRPYFDGARGDPLRISRPSRRSSSATTSSYFSGKAAALRAP